VHGSVLANRSSFTLPAPVALTVLAAGVILAAVVNATFSLLAANGAALMFVIVSTRGRQSPKVSWSGPRRPVT
jgi:hypothetical protein